MRIVLTGAAGFIGSHIAHHLVNKREDEVIGIDKFTTYYDSGIKRKNIESLRADRFTLIEEDLNAADLEKLLDGADVVIHQAGQPGVRPSWGQNFDGYIDNNIGATQRLLEAARKKPTIKRFIYASSSSIYGDAEKFPTSESTTPAPRSPYGVTKLAAEHLCGVYAENYGLPVVSLRYFTVYGPGQRPDMAFTKFCKAALKGEHLEVYGDGSQERDFTFVDDVVDANLRAIDRDLQEGTVLNIAGGSHASISEILKNIEAIHGQKIHINYGEPARGDVKRTSGDTSRAQSDLGWTPVTTLEEGLRRQYEWAHDTFIEKE